MCFEPCTEKVCRLSRFYSFVYKRYNENQFLAADDFFWENILFQFLSEVIEILLLFIISTIKCTAGTPYRGGGGFNSRFLKFGDER